MTETPSKTDTTDKTTNATDASVQQPSPEPRVDQSRRERTDTMSQEDYDKWRMSKDDTRWGDPDDDLAGHQKFEADGDRYFLDGQEVDFTEPTNQKKDDSNWSIQQSIRLYQPRQGIYWWHPENGVFSPVAGSRAGSGDTGTVPGEVPRGTVFPEENSAIQLKESDAHLENIERAKEMRERTAPMTSRR